MAKIEIYLVMAFVRIANEQLATGYLAPLNGLITPSYQISASYKVKNGIKHLVIVVMGWEY